MNKKMSVLFVALTILSGLVGGAIAVYIFSPKVTVADEARSKVLTIEKLNIVDKNGKLKAIIRVGEFGGGEVVVFSKDNYVAACMGTLPSGGIVNVGTKGNGSVGLLSVGEFGGDVSVFSKDGKIKVDVGVNELGNGGIGIWDKNGYRLR